MKLRNFYKIDHTKKPIPGSNIRRKSKPQGHQWKELPNFCCSPIDPNCSCGDRYFVQIDKNGNPIDGTLIKRTNAIGAPQPVRGIKYAELNWECCADQVLACSSEPISAGMPELLSDRDTLDVNWCGIVAIVSNLGGDPVGDVADAVAAILNDKLDINGDPVPGFEDVTFVGNPDGTVTMTGRYCAECSAELISQNVTGG